jgi:tetratricopeptide (TPR) repeat protein
MSKRKNIYLICFILYFLLPYTAYAQGTGIDSLQRLLANTKDRNKEIDILINLAHEYLFISPDSTIYYSQRAESLAKNRKNRNKEARSILRKGLGYWSRGDLENALISFKRSLAIAENIADKSIKARNIESIGLIYLDLGTYELSLTYYQKALALFQEMKDYERIAAVMSNIGFIYNNLQRIDSAQYFFEKAKPMTEKYNADFQAFVYIGLGDIKVKLKKYDEALRELNKALYFAQAQHDKQDLSSIYQLLAGIELDRKNIPIAEIYAAKSIKIALASNMKERIYRAYEIYSKLLDAKGDIKNALIYYKLFIAYKDSVQSTIAKNSLQLFEYEKRQGEIVSLKAKQAQQLLLNRLIMTALWLVLILAVCIFLNRQKIIKINKNLQTAYIQIQEKQEEILMQNEELHLHQEEIHTLNNNLEILVTERTDKLAESNKRLTEYAFFNAHKLRAPVATILGLYELLKLNPNLMEKEFIIEKIKEYIIRLDEMVKESQSLLSQDSSD